MTDLLLNPEFWSAISQLAWPVAIVVVAFSFRKIVFQLFDRETLTIKVAGMELSVKDATEQAGKGISDLQERVAQLESGKLTPSESKVNRPDSLMASILWVDDFPSNNAFIIEKLERDGFRIRKELSTDAGIAALKEDHFNVVISDLGRRENGRENKFAGLDLVRAIRASANEIPVLIFAGPRGLENTERLISAGADQVTNSAVDVFKFVEQILGE